MEEEKCFFNECNNEIKYYRKLDSNSRPICEKHYNLLPFLEKRHYFIIKQFIKLKDKKK